MFGQQCQSLLTTPLCLQHCASKDLYSCVLRVVLCEVLGQLLSGVGVPSNKLGKGLGGGQVGVVFFAGDSLEHLRCLPKGNLGTELEYASGELVLGGQRGGLEVDHSLVLARVEGRVDVEELWMG